MSQQIGLVAAALPEDARVLAPEVEFGSNFYPYQTHEAREIEVETVPLRELEDRIDEGVDLVAVSVV